MSDFKKIDREKTYIACDINDDPKKIKIRVGGSDPHKFAPSINFSFQCESDSEKYFLNFADDLLEIDTTGIDENWAGDELVIYDGARGTKFKNTKNNIKLSALFKDKSRIKPVKYRIKKSPGISFHYQPQLTLEQIAAGFTRPDNVVGSYAIYCDKINRFKTVDGDTIVNYSTGKLGHIFAPYWKDAIGNKIKTSQQIKNNILEVDSPNKVWIDSAVLPIELDPDVGYTTIGASGQNWGGNNITAAGPWTAGDTFNADTCYLYLNSSDGGTGELTLGIYDDSSALPNNLLGDTSAIMSPSTNAWNSASLDFPVSITSGVDYWIGFHSNANRNISYDSVGSEKIKYKGATYTSGVLVDPFPASPNNWNNRLSIYFSGTSGIDEPFITYSTIIYNTMGEQI